MIALVWCCPCDNKNNFHPIPAHSHLSQEDVFFRIWCIQENILLGPWDKWFSRKTTLKFLNVSFLGHPVQMCDFWNTDQ